MTEVTVVPTHVLITAIEDKAVCVIANALVRRRTPIVSELSGEVERRPVTVARSRKKDTVAVGSSNLIALNAVLGSPLPCTFIL